MNNLSAESVKRKQVEKMFNNISGRYDLLNHLLSFGIDRRWRSRLIKRLDFADKFSLLDVATGTGDLAIAAALKTEADITATDIADSMMEAGRRKVEKRNLSDRITFVRAEAENLPFADSSFDAVIVAFGVRNFGDPEAGLREIHRVLKPHGKFLVLEFGMPRNFLLRTFYRFYFRKILPLAGRIVSGHFNAYSYLPESVEKFPHGDDFVALLNDAGFTNAGFTPLSGGIAMLYEHQLHKVEAGTAE